MTFAEPQTAAELRQHYKAVRSRVWPSVAVKPVFIPPAIPAYFKTTREQERRFMAEAHGLIELVIKKRPEAEFLTSEQVFRTDAIFHACATVGRCTVTEIKSQRRFRQFVTARMVFYYLARKHTELSYPAIGRLVGHRDHSSVLHGIRTVEEALQDGREPYASFYIKALAILEGGE